MRFDYTLTDIRVGIEIALDQLQDRARNAIEDVADFVAGEAKDRAPFAEGVLTESIRGETEENRGKFTAIIMVPVNAPSQSYAVKMHEDHYNLGPGSAAKETRVGKRVGRRYISRAIDDNRPRILKMIAAELKR